MATRGSIVHTCNSIDVKTFRGHPKNVSFINAIFSKYGFRQNVSHGFYKQNPLEKIIIFTIYQNYTLALRK